MNPNPATMNPNPAFAEPFSPSKGLKRTWREIDGRNTSSDSALATPGTIMFAGTAGWFESLREAYEGSSQQARLANNGKGECCGSVGVEEWSARALEARCRRVGVEEWSSGGAI